MPRVFAAGYVLVLFWWSFPSTAEAQLSRLREDVRAARPEEAPPKENSDDECRKKNKDSFRDSDDCDEQTFDDREAWLPFKAVGYAVTAPFWGPVVLADNGEQPPDYDLPYPYADASPGYMTYDSERYYLPDWSLRTITEYGSDLDDLSFIGARGIFESSARLGIDSEFRYWHEELAAVTSDQLWTGDANLVYRFARGEKLQMRTGVGFNWLADEVGSDFGFNFTYGGDWFPHRPLIISADLDWGTLSNTELFRARTTVGINVRPVEVYTGYDYFDATAFRAHSLIAGLRVWF